MSGAPARLAGLLLGLIAAAAAAAPAAGPAGGDAPAEAVFDHPADARALQAVLGPAAASLGSAAAVRGEFSQRKFLHELSQPLRSSGEFLVARELGIDWHTRMPFDADLLLTPTALVQRDGAGQAQRTEAAEQPGLAAVVQVFDALFALDLPRLAERFTLYGLRSGDRWTLGLKPREAAFANVVGAVVITGTQQPERIVLHEAGGDRTEIVFSHQAVLGALGDAERRRFAGN